MSMIHSFLQAASRFLGQRYRWGGGHAGRLHGPAPVDCSGLVSQAAMMVGLPGIQGTARDLQRKGHAVAMRHLQPGDLVFKGYPAHHVAIYIGNGQVIEAPRRGSKVKISSVRGFTSARRIFHDQAALPVDNVRTHRGRAATVRLAEAG